MKGEKNLTLGEIMALDGGQICDQNSLKLKLAEQLQTASDLIARLDDDAYAAGEGSIGAHIRHNLNFVDAIITGCLKGSIDYSQRSRDRRIETDRQAAIARIDDLVEMIEALSIDLEMPLDITSEIDPHIVHSSSLGRELEFVISHTIHHHALIKERLQLGGVELEENFGVAPSTLEYRSRSAR